MPVATDRSPWSKVGELGSLLLKMLIMMVIDLGGQSFEFSFLVDQRDNLRRVASWEMISEKKLFF